jgi:hypothetical protein
MPELWDKKADDTGETQSGSKPFKLWDSVEEMRRRRSGR